MRKEDIDALKNLPLFMDMADATFERIMRPSFVQSFPPRTTLIKEDEPADFLFAILDGLVLMSAKSDDGETALAEARHQTRTDALRRAGDQRNLLRAHDGSFGFEQGTCVGGPPRAGRFTPLGVD